MTDTSAFRNAAGAFMKEITYNDNSSEYCTSEQERRCQKEIMLSQYETPNGEAYTEEHLDGRG